MFKLIIEDDEGKTTVVPITRDEITIGRKEGNNIRLTERNVSRNHARLSRQNGSVLIEDLDSYNGIRINGDRIQVKAPVKVQEGDLIEIGDYHLAIQLEGAAEPALAGAQPMEEATQRVSLHASAQTVDEVTSQVAMPSAALGGPTEDGLAPAPLHRSSPVPESTMPMRLDLAKGQDDEQPLQRRAEPTAIIRTSDLPPPSTSSATDSARLVVVSTQLAGKTFALTRDAAVLGRTDENDIQIDHRSVSRNHAKIIREGARFSVVDLGSANGVLVNGEEYKKIDLRKGDIIELGHVKLRFVEAGEAFELSAADLERMQKDDGGDDGFGSDQATGLVTGRSNARKSAALPVKWIAIGGGAVVLLAVVAVVAIAGGGGKKPGEDKPPEQVVVAEPPHPEPPDTDRKPPRKDPEKPVEKRPERPDADKLVKQAQEHFKKGEFGKARELFTKALDAGDIDDAARKGLEAVDRELAAKQQLDEALSRKEADLMGAWRALKEVAPGTRARERAQAEMKTIRPKLVARLVKEGEKALDDGDAQGARQYAQDALDIDDGARDALRLLDKAEKALKGARRPVRPPPSNPRPAGDNNNGNNAQNKALDARKALEDGNRAILLGNFDEAVAKGKLGLKLDSSLTEAHKLLGVAYARQGKYCDAKYHYKKFIELNPASPMVDRIKQILQGPELQNCQ